MAQNMTDLSWDEWESSFNVDDGRMKFRENVLHGKCWEFMGKISQNLFAGDSGILGIYACENR